MPLEMAQRDLLLLQTSRPAGVATEVFAYGRMPLAFSARCFTARHRNLAKDDCQFSCIAHPDGLLMRTRENEGFLVLNGTQTQSAKVYNLLAELSTMAAMGVDVARISPQSDHTVNIVQLFHDVLTQQTTVNDAISILADKLPGEPCNGYWYGQPGMAHGDTPSLQATV
jgi:collagenase-like PrtC family protease